jgi:hypothetical protein
MSINSGYERNVELIKAAKIEINALLEEYRRAHAEFIATTTSSEITALLQNSKLTTKYYNDALTTDVGNDKDAIIAQAKTNMDTAKNAYTQALEINNEKKVEQRAALESLYNQITGKTDNMNSLLDTILNTEKNNRSRIASILDMRKQLEQINASNKKIRTKIMKKTEGDATQAELSGKISISSLKTESNFSKYILYLLFMIFFTVCLIYIYIVPETGNLDMFMLALGIIIIVYYLYDYFTKKIRAMAR